MGGRPGGHKVDRLVTLPRMFWTRLHRNTATWLALIAVLAFALAPTVSRAMAYANGEATWAEVCTPLGMKLKAVADVGEESPAAQAGALEHCGYCAFSAGAAPLPTAAAQVWPAAAAAGALPALFLQAPRTLFAWQSAQARAPPSHS